MGTAPAERSWFVPDDFGATHGIDNPACCAASGEPPELAAMTATGATCT